MPRIAGAPRRTAALGVVVALALSLLAPAVGGAGPGPAAGTRSTAARRPPAPAAGTRSTAARRAPAPAGPVERLRRDVVAHLARSGAGVQAAAVALDELGVVVSVRAGELLPPASTQKLYTAGAALLALGPGRRLRTEVRVTRDAPPPPAGPSLPLPVAPSLPLPVSPSLPPPLGPGPPPAPAVDRSVVRDLALVAGGDPSLSGAGVDALAAAVAAAGVRRVAGALWVDDSRYDRARAAPGWKAHYVPRESGPLSALSVDVNGWRRDAAFLSDPATPNGVRFQDALAGHGVAVDGPVSLGPLPGGPGEVVAVSESAPVADLVRHVLAASDNFQSELLLKEVGATAGDQGTTAGGVAVLERLQDSMGVPRGRSADGSGLSSLDRQSAAGEVRWLVAVDASAAGPAFVAALPRYCSGTGTLRTRLCGTPAAGRMAAKTGSLPGVVTLAGTGTTGSGRRVWFAFLLSGVRSAPQARAAVDQAVLTLATSGA